MHNLNTSNDFYRLIKIKNDKIIGCLLIIFLNYTLAESTDYEHEYCQFETFQPTCPNLNEVVLITSARYGRMKVGKCITKEEVSGFSQDQKYFGCSSDVLDVVQQKCSLKRMCEIKIYNTSLEKTRTCFSGLNMYLSVEYSCIYAVDDQNANCRIQALASTPKYLTMQGMLNNLNCGSNSNPWMIEASRGQNVQLSFISIGNKVNTRIGCDLEIGWMSEKSLHTVDNVTFCENGIFVKSRDRTGDANQFLSSSSIVQIIINNYKKYQEIDKNNMLGIVLLKIEAEGCLDIIPPEDTWLKRNGDDIVIGCYSSKQSWYLRCENKKWIGTIGNCSAGKTIEKVNAGDVIEAEITKEQINDENQTLIIVAISGVGVVICSMIVCFGAVCVKRVTKKPQTPNFYGKHPICYSDGQYTMNGQSLLNTQQKYKNVDHDVKSIDVVNGHEAAMETTSKDNNYFILEDLK